MGKRFKVILSTGLAMFSMFFGAGNVVFPLDLGRVAGNLNVYAIIGLLLTAVTVPFAGLLAMFLFEGNYRAFFERIGKVPGFLVIVVLMFAIGPFIAIPRCITLSFSTLKLYMPAVKLVYFSIGACIILYIFTVKRRRILDLLGHVLSPILLVSLILLIVKGLFHHPVAPVTDCTRFGIFAYGLREGYNTLDLFGAFFFSVVILIGLRRALGKDLETDTPAGKKRFFTITLTASSIAAILLGIVYGGFSYVASFYSSVLGTVQQDTQLSVLASTVLGNYGGIIANVAVSLACLTTAITLVAVFAEFMQNEVFKRRFNYSTCLLMTLILSFIVSNLGFMGIKQLSAPILFVFYPALILLTFLNLAYKFFGFKYVKIPVLIAFVISLFLYLK